MANGKPYHRTNEASRIASPLDSRRQKRGQTPSLARSPCHCALGPDPVRSARGRLRRHLPMERRGYSKGPVFVKSRNKVGGHTVGRFCRHALSPKTWQSYRNSGCFLISAGCFSTDTGDSSTGSTGACPNGVGEFGARVGQVLRGTATQVWHAASRPRAGHGVERRVARPWSRCCERSNR